MFNDQDFIEFSQQFQKFNAEHCGYKTIKLSKRCHELHVFQSQSLSLECVIICGQFTEEVSEYHALIVRSEGFMELDRFSISQKTLSKLTLEIV